MDNARYRELELNPNARLTPDEIVQGWHFCPAWDFMLVGPGSPESISCDCFDEPHRPSLLQDMAVGLWIVPKGFVSDGCTLPRWLPKCVRRWLDCKRYYPFCVLHDFQRRYGLIPIDQADRELCQDIAHFNRFHAWIYRIALRLARRYYNETQPLPERWRLYRKPW